MFLRFYDEGLAQASFVVACDRTREGVVIDTRRDASVYLEAARQHGVNRDLLRWRQRYRTLLGVANRPRAHALDVLSA